MTLKWIKKIEGVKIIKTLKRKNKHYIYNSLRCNFHSDYNLKEIPILDGHNLHFSYCFKKVDNFYKPTLKPYVIRSRFSIKMKKYKPTNLE